MCERERGENLYFLPKSVVDAAYDDIYNSFEFFRVEGDDHPPPSPLTYLPPYYI